MNIFCSKGVIAPLSSGLRNLSCLMAPSTCLYGAHNRVLDHLFIYYKKVVTNIVRMANVYSKFQVMPVF